ncbi:MAG TPA: AI-2E family transporter [Gammaproteobacteria bacterium]
MNETQKWWVLGLTIFTGWLLYLLAPVLTPFVIAALLAYLGDPLADRLESMKLSRTMAVVIVFFIMILIGLLSLFFLIPLIERQLLGFIDSVPGLINTIQTKFIPKLADIFGFDPEAINLDSLKQAVASNWQDVGSVAGKVMMKISESGQAIVTWFAYLLLIPVVTFYLLRDWDHLIASFRDLIPRKQVGFISQLAHECDQVLSEFMRGQLLVMLALSIIYSIGLWIAGLEFALLIGMLAGLVSFVPYLGVLVGSIAAVIAALIQFNDVWHLVYVGLVFGVGQALEGMVLSPLLVGDRIGLHPVAVIFAVMAGGQLFGFFGVLLALPVAALIVVMLRHMHEFYIKSGMYQP